MSEKVEIEAPPAPIVSASQINASGPNRMPKQLFHGFNRELSMRQWETKLERMFPKVKYKGKQ